MSSTSVILTIKIYWNLFCKLILGIILAVVSLLAHISLLSLSGWFLAAAALAGLANNTLTFNYLLPAVGIRLFSLLRILGRYGERLVGHYTTFYLLQQLRISIFRKLLTVSSANLPHFHVTDWLTTLIADVSALDYIYLRLILPLLTTIFVFLAVSFFLWSLDHCLALILVSTLFTLLLSIALVFYFSSRSAGVVITQLTTKFRNLLIEWLQHQVVLVLFAAQKNCAKQLTLITEKWYEQQQFHAKLSGAAQGLLLLLSGVTLLGMIELSVAACVQHHYATSIIACISFLTCSIFEGLYPIATAFQYFTQAQMSIRRVKYLATQIPPTVIFLNRASLIDGSQIELFFNQVTFMYPTRYQPALQKFTFSLSPGDKTALLGHTGCGKSTVLQLITGDLVPTQGSIHINQRPLTDYSESQLRSFMGVLSQRVHVFSATLRDNLRIASPKANDRAFIEVLHKVGLEHLLDTQSLNCWLGDGGRPLSGGEQRRLGVARVLLCEKPLLLLDEPTESLDPQNEQKIFQLLLKHANDKSLIVITHRPHGLNLLDRILVLEDGQLVEQGTPKELLAKQNYYYELQKQLL